MIINKKIKLKYVLEVILNKINFIEMEFKILFWKVKFLVLYSVFNKV